VTPPVTPPVAPPGPPSTCNAGAACTVTEECAVECSAGSVAYCLECVDNVCQTTSLCTIGACSAENRACLEPLTPVAPPVALAPTAVCTVATFDAGYTCISNLASGLVCSQRVIVCSASIAGNANATEAGECLLNSIGASSNTVDCDYEANMQTCCGVNVIGLACTNQNECPENYVCSGIEGAGSNATQQCSYAYNCVASTCTNAAPIAFQAPATVNNCTDAPTIGCNSTFSIALREDNELTSMLLCEDPLTPYAPGSSVAFFYLPTSTLAMNAYNVSFSVYAPNDINFAVRHLLSCSSDSVCGAALTPRQPALNLFQYNEVVTLDRLGTQRGYILFGGSSFAPLNGYIVNVSVQCAYVLPPLCSQIVVQACTGSEDCPLAAPYCKTTLGRCQTLIGGACNSSSDCVEAFNMTCNVNSCTCQGPAQKDPCIQSNYLNALSNCLFTPAAPANCSIGVSECYNTYLGNGADAGTYDLALFQSLASCSLGVLDVQTSCLISSCLQSYCDAPATCTVPSLQSCTVDTDCPNAYPFCDTYNGVCTGVGASPCSAGNDCGNRQCQSDCTCVAGSATCNTLNGRNGITNKINSCLATQVGSCAQRIALCQTASYTGGFGLTNATVIGNINQCIATASLPGCSVSSCVTSGYAAPPLQCLTDTQCPCGQCCQSNQCVTCPDTCTTSANCPNGRPICAAANNRCTSNTDCGASTPPVSPPKQITLLPNSVTGPAARQVSNQAKISDPDLSWLDWFWTL
jgi:hypothetical protein